MFFFGRKSHGSMSFWKNSIEFDRPGEEVTKIPGCLSLSLGLTLIPQVPGMCR